MMKPGGNSCCCLPFKDQKKMRGNRKRNLTWAVAKEISSCVKQQRPSHIDWRAKIGQVSASLLTQFYLFFLFFSVHGKTGTGKSDLVVLKMHQGRDSFACPLANPLYGLFSSSIGELHPKNLGDVPSGASGSEINHKPFRSSDKKTKQKQTNIKREQILTSTQRPGLFWGVGALCG